MLIGEKFKGTFERIIIGAEVLNNRPNVEAMGNCTRFIQSTKPVSALSMV
jgi:hypothetical protein